MTTYYRNPEVKRTKASKLIKAIRIRGGEWSGAQRVSGIGGVFNLELGLVTQMC